MAMETNALASKQTQVRQQMGNLANAIGELAEDIKRMEERATPVLSIGPMHKESDSQKAPSQALCPLAEELRAKVNTIRSYSSQIRAIASRCEA